MVIASSTYSQTPPNENSTAQVIHRMINTPEYRNVHLGIIVQSMDTGKIIYEEGAYSLFTPASVTKLFPATASIYYLKPSFRFPTLLSYIGSIRNGILNGNLYLRFTGDPMLTRGDLEPLFQRLSLAGVHAINGQVFIDNMSYNSIPYPPGTLLDDATYSYGAPIDAIIINRNRFYLEITPTTVGSSPIITSSLPRGVVTFINHLITTNNFQTGCPITIYSNDQNVYSLYGCVPVNGGRQGRAVAIHDVLPFTQAIVLGYLEKYHIHYDKTVAVQTTPRFATVIAAHYSDTLQNLVTRMLKRSDNVIANTLWKKLGETVYNGIPGSWLTGKMAVQHLLGPVTGINFAQLLMDDGAGLSRYDLISPSQFAQLLYFVYHNKNVWPSIYNALPIGGRDGTLGGRMGNNGKSGAIHAKTGSMTGVSALAGFITTQHRGNLAFAIMVNGFIGKKHPYSNLEDRICDYLVHSQG